MLMQLELPLQRAWTPEQAAACVDTDWCRPSFPRAPDGCDQGVPYRALQAAVRAGLVETRSVTRVRNCLTGVEHDVIGETRFSGRVQYHVCGMRCTCTPTVARCAGGGWAEWRRVEA